MEPFKVCWDPDHAENQDFSGVNLDLLNSLWFLKWLNMHTTRIHHRLWPSQRTRTLGDQCYHLSNGAATLQILTFAKCVMVLSLWSLVEMKNNLIPSVLDGGSLAIGSEVNSSWSGYQISFSWWLESCLKIFGAVCVCVSHSVMSDSLQPHGLYSLPGFSVHGILQARILEGDHLLLQVIFLTQGLNPGLLY